MKKLMCAIAAVSAGICFADVTSANVVGYNTAKTVSGFQGAGTCFMAIGKTGTMADLQVTGYGDSYEDQNIQAVKLDTYGRDTGTKMYWVDADYGSDGVWYGWYNDGWDVDLNSTPLASGEGVWFMSPNTDIKIQSSGEVNNEVIPVTLVAGYQLCPNATPTTVKMNKAYMNGYGEGYEDQNIQAVKLDTFGRDSGDKMYWVDADYGSDGVWYGWYNDGWDVELGENTTLEPGEAVWLTSPTAGWTLNWPSPLAKDAE